MKGPKSVPASDRFDRFVSPEPNCGCHLWTGFVNNKGYGTIGGPSRSKIYAHRLAWERENGPIPAGLYVLHRCDVPSCVNPEHLFLGDQQANMADCVAKDRNNRGERSGTRKLTAADVHAIRADQRRPYRLIAADYGIGAPTVSGIKTRRYWRQLRG